MFQANRTLFAIAALLGAATGFFANSKLGDAQHSIRYRSFACGVMDAAERSGQVNRAQADDLFVALAPLLGTTRAADAAPVPRADRCNPSP